MQGSVVENIDGTFLQDHIPDGIDIVSHMEENLVHIVDVDIPVEDNDDLGRCHLTEPPEAVHNLMCLPGIFFVDRYKDKVVKAAGNGKFNIRYFRNNKLNEGEEDFLCQCPEKGVFESRPSDSY